MVFPWGLLVITRLDLKPNQTELLCSVYEKACVPAANNQPISTNDGKAVFLKECQLFLSRPSVWMIVCLKLLDSVFGEHCSLGLFWDTGGGITYSRSERKRKTLSYSLPQNNCAVLQDPLRENRRNQWRS